MRHQTVSESTENKAQTVILADETKPIFTRMWTLLYKLKKKKKGKMTLEKIDAC